MKWANYKAYIWKTLELMQDLQPAAGRGWETVNSILQPVLTTKEAASQGLVLVELSTSHRQPSDCTCRRNVMPCTEACACLADKSCQNPEHWLTIPLMLKQPTKDCHWYCLTTSLHQNMCSRYLCRLISSYIHPKRIINKGLSKWRINAYEAFHKCAVCAFSATHFCKTELF